MKKVIALLRVQAEEKEIEHVIVKTDEDGKEEREVIKQKHYVFPSVPGMKVDVLASNPKAPNREQLWLVETTRPVVVALAGEEEVEWLSLEAAEGLLAAWGKQVPLRELLSSRGLEVAFPPEVS